MSKIIVANPQNVVSEDLKYFEGKNTVTLFEGKVRELNNVFVSHEGLCVKNGLFMPSSAYNMIGKEDNTHFIEMWKLATEQYFVSHYGKSLPLQKMEGNFLLIHSKWFNFYFWLTSCLYRLIQTELYHDEVKLILPDQLAKHKFVQDSLKMFPNLEICPVSDGTHLKVEHLVFPECRKWSVSISPKTAKAVSEKVLAYAESHYTLPQNISHNIYLNRKKTGKRGFTNDQEVEALLLKNGFTSIAFEDYNIYEQALILEQAKNLVGLHGAGFANIIHMEANTSLLELIAYPPEIHEHRTGYWRLSGVKKINYYYQFCEIIVDPTVSVLLNNNLKVDVEKLEKNIKLMLS
jgi:capsular polysaccharide biosynthesis protein